jgi:hypothetical protein
MTIGSRDKLARPIDAGADIRIPHRAGLHEVDGAAQHLRQGFFQPEVSVQEWQAVVGRELHQEVGVAGVRVEVHRSRSRAEHLQPLHAEAAADVRDRVAMLFDQRVHGAST